MRQFALNRLLQIFCNNFRCGSLLSTDCFKYFVIILGAAVHSRQIAANHFAIELQLGNLSLIASKLISIHGFLADGMIILL